MKQVKKDKIAHLSGESTEKRSVIYMSAKQQEAKSLRDKMEKIDASGPNAMFGDDDMYFDLQLEQFGVDNNVLREPATERVFHAWVEDWENEIRFKNDSVTEARLLQKYKGLVFSDPDNNKYIQSLRKTWSIDRGVEMDGLLLLSVQRMEWRMSLLHLNWLVSDREHTTSKWSKGDSCCGGRGDVEDDEGGRGRINVFY